jgi:erythronate-4-phosphate dehydrogenase
MKEYSVSKKRVKFSIGWKMKVVADKNILFVGEAFAEFGDVVLKAGREIRNTDLRDADVLLVRTVTRVDEVLLRNTSVKFVGTATIGYDHIDTQYLSERRIAFSYAPGCNANSVAEYIVASLFVLARRYALKLDELTLGVVGVGNVGSKVAEKAALLGMEVLLNDPPKQRITGDGRYLHLNRIVREADIVSFHVPLTIEGADATYHLGGAGLFGNLKRGAFVINTSRGPVFDTGALLHALRDGPIRSAVIDVWEGEPFIVTDLLERIDIGTPHIAGYSRDGKANATAMLYEAACSYFDISPRWKPEGLPQPEHPVITVIPVNCDPLTGIGEIIRKAYDIERDDRALRKILTLQPDERAAYFDRLRNDYPVRREYRSMTVRAPKKCKKIARTLRALGFNSDN